MSKLMVLLRRTISVMALIGVAAAPFVAYKAIQVARKSVDRPWPGMTALTAANGETLTALSLLLPRQEGTRVDFSLDTLLDVPGGGRLRAATVYSVGGAPMIANALATTTGFDVDFYASWEGSSLSSPDGSPRTNLKRHIKQVQDLLVLGSGVHQLSAPGTYSDGAFFQTFLLDLSALRGIFLGEGSASSRPQPSPIPIPSTSEQATGLNPAEVTIRVLNQGAPAGSATRLTKELQQKGFALAEVGQGPGNTVVGNFIYYSIRADWAQVVADALRDRTFAIKELPAVYRDTTDLTIVLGAPRASRSESARPAVSTRRPNPTTSPSTVTVN